MSSTLLIVIGLLLLLGLAGIAWLIFSLKNQPKPDDSAQIQTLTMLQNQLAHLQRDLSERMGQTNQVIQQQFSSSTNVVRDVTERMVKVEEIARQVLNETSELQKLQQILKNPKQRGVLGEYFLETLLKNILPPESFQMQYPFKNGEIVDAAVFIRDKVVPIDSKFSLENYNRLTEDLQAADREKLETVFLNDLKTRIKETSKYIRPDENTMDFAFMFIPHEAIYYDLLVNRIGIKNEENLIQRAAATYHVIIVSPTSFLAYLQTVLQGLRALQIEEQAKEIQIRIGEMGKHLNAYEGYFTAVGKNLGTVVNQYNLSQKEFAKIDKDILRITGAANNFQADLLDKPTILET